MTQQDQSVEVQQNQSVERQDQSVETHDQSVTDRFPKMSIEDLNEKLKRSVKYFKENFTSLELGDFCFDSTNREFVLAQLETIRTNIIGLRNSKKDYSMIKQERKEAIRLKNIENEQNPRDLKYVGNKYCFLFPKGECLKGDRCKFLHPKDITLCKLAEEKHLKDRLRENKSHKNKKITTETVDESVSIQ
jgi:hypothetical protein